MSNQRNPFLINVGFLANQNVGTFRDIHFDLPEVNLSPDLPTRNMKGVIKFSKTPQGVLAEAQFETESPANCVRCLTDFDQHLTTEFKELYSYSTHPTTEENMIIPDDSNIDIRPILREYLLLEVPIKALCKPDCKGLCTVCGENLNITTCVHQTEPGRDSN